MGARPTKTPSLPETGAKDFLDKLKEIAEVREGRRGDKLDRFVTLRELESAGVVHQLSGGGLGGGRPGGGPGTIPGHEQILDPPPDYGDNDPTRPPRPTGVVARGIGENQIMVVFDSPPYGNHWFAEIYRIPKTYSRIATVPVTNDFLVPNFNINLPCTGIAAGANPNTYFIGTTFGTTYVDELPADGFYNPNDPQATQNLPLRDQDPLSNALSPTPFYYVVRFVSRARIGSDMSTPPAKGVRMLNPVEILDIMSSNIRNTRAFDNLRSLIGNTPASLMNEVRDAFGGGGLANYTNAIKADLTGKFEDLDIIIKDDQRAVADTTYWQAAMPAGGTGFDPTNTIRLLINNYSVNLDLNNQPVSITLNVTHVSGPTNQTIPQNTEMLVFAPGENPLAFLAGHRLVSLAQNSPGQNQTSSLTFKYEDWMPGATISAATLTRAAYLIHTVGSSSITLGPPVVASALQNIFVSVKPDSAIARRVDALELRLGNALHAANTVVSEVTLDMSNLTQSYTIGLTRDNNGLLSSAGMSLSMEGALYSQEPPTSAFVVSADQFAIMGSVSNAFRLTDWNPVFSGQTVTYVTVSSPRTFIEGTKIAFVVPKKWLRETDVPTPGEVPLTTEPGGDPSNDKRVTNPFPLPGESLGAREKLSKQQNEQRAKSVNDTTKTNTLKRVLQLYVTPNEAWAEGFRNITLEVSDVSDQPFVDPATNQTRWTITLRRVGTSTIAIPGNLVATPPPGSEDEREFWRNINIMMMPEQNIPFIVDTTQSVVGIRGTLVVDGLISTQEIEVSRLLRASSAWINNIVGVNATINTIIGQRIIAGNYAGVSVKPHIIGGNPNAGSPGPVVTPLGPDEGGPASPGAPFYGQYIVSLKNPAADGLTGKPIRMYKPYFTWDGKKYNENEGQGIDAFFVDGGGNVFIGGNLTVRTDSGGPDACSMLVGAAGSGRRITGGERYALWVGPKTAIFDNSVNDAEAVFWVKEATLNNKPQAGFNADLFLNGTPLSQPMLATGLHEIPLNPTQTNYDPETETDKYFLGNSTGSPRSWAAGLRAVSDKTSVDSDGVIEIRRRTDGSMPPIMVMASVNLARHVSSSNKDDKRFATVLMLTGPNGNIAVASHEMDDYPPDTYTDTLMGVCKPKDPGFYRVRVMLFNMDTDNGTPITSPSSAGYMCILNGWTSMATYLTEELASGGSLKLLPPGTPPFGWAPTKELIRQGQAPNTPPEHLPGGGATPVAPGWNETP